MACVGKSCAMRAGLLARLPVALRAVGSWARVLAPSTAVPGTHHRIAGAARPMLLPLRAYAYDAAAAESAAEVGEVDFDPAAANSVSLIGTVGAKNELKVFERSKLLPFSLAFKSNRRNPQEVEWISVEVWGPLAERVDQTLQKGDRVAVKGRLRFDKWQDREGAQRTTLKVVAASVAKVRSTYANGGGGAEAVEPAFFDPQAAAAAGAAQWATAAQQPWEQPPPQQQQQAQGAAPWASQQPQQAAAAAPSGGPTTEEKWMDFFENPSEWYDNRTTKKGRQPDFKKKGYNAPALWLDSRDTPAWVASEIERLDKSRQQL